MLEVSICARGNEEMPESGTVRILVKAMTAYEAVMKALDMLAERDTIETVEAFDEDTSTTAFRNDDNNGWNIEIEGGEPKSSTIRFMVYDWRFE